MYRYLSIVVAAAFLISSINGLLPLRHIPHDHLIVGLVTAEQLRAHEADEAAELDSSASSSFPTSPPGITITPTGGAIISLAQNAGNIAGAQFFDLGLWIVFCLIAPLACHSLTPSRSPTQTLFLPSFDPPPRFAFASS